MRNIPFSPPDITEKEVEAAARVLRSGWITTGPETKAFENDITAYCSAEKTACLNSATAALECTLRLLGIGKGDEVITSAYTYTATAAAVCHTGAKVRLCDTAKDSFFMDYDKLYDMITPKTKAIIAVDVGGKMCDYNRIFDIVNSKSLMFQADNDLQQAYDRCIVIADAAHSLGAEYDGARSGTVADFTCFSFHAVKNVTTAEGGAAVLKPHKSVDSDYVYKNYMLLSLHGQNKDALAKTKAGAWEYDITAPLYKCNMTDIMSAIGRVQLARYPEMLNKRQKIWDIFDNALNGGIFIKPARTGAYENSAYYSSSCHLYQLRLCGYTADMRNEIIEKAAQSGVNCNVHYKPLPMLTAYKNLGFNIADFPNAYSQYQNEISLPLNSKMSEDDAEYTAQVINKIVNR